MKAALSMAFNKYFELVMSINVTGVNKHCIADHQNSTDISNKDPKGPVFHDRIPGCPHTLNLQK